MEDTLVQDSVGKIPDPGQDVVLLVVDDRTDKDDTRGIADDVRCPNRSFFEQRISWISRVLKSERQKPLLGTDFKGSHANETSTVKASSRLFSALKLKIPQDVGQIRLENQEEHSEFGECKSGFSDNDFEMLDGSYEEGKLPSFYECLTHYFIAMYFLEIFKLIAELVVEIGQLDDEVATYFGFGMLMLDFVFLIPLFMEVTLSLMLSGWKKYTQKQDNTLWLIILIVSAFTIMLQTANIMSSTQMILIDFARSILRVTRVFIIHNKLNIVWRSPFSHFKVSPELLRENK